MHNTTTMRAQRLDTSTLEYQVTDVPIPVPGKGEVLIKVAFCGICHSDIGTLEGKVPTFLPVITQGHEASGTIASIGPDVEGWEIGDRVIPASGRACGECEYCTSGDPYHCCNLQIMSSSYDGAWAEYTVASALNLTRVPDNVSMEQAAILADAVATPYAAVVHTAKVRVGESVGIWGAGGVGTHLVQLARLAGAHPIIVMDIDADVRERALDRGADHAFDSRDPDLQRKIADATDGRMLDVAFDAVGIKPTFEQALSMIRARGRLIGVGLSDQEVSLGTSFGFNVQGKNVFGHLGYEFRDIGVLARLVSAGRLDLSGSISEIITLEDVAVGIKKLQRHEGHPVRILVQP